MAPKRQPSPPKHPSPPPSSSSSEEDDEDEEEEEEEEEKQNNNFQVSAPISSQPSKNPIPPKPTSDLNYTPKPNSSTEEDSDDSGDSEESSEDANAKTLKTQIRPTQIKKKEEEESDESGSDSGSDSDLPPPKGKPVKPISSRPMDDSPKPVSKKESAAKPSTAQKRPAAPESNDKDSKRQKKPDAGGEEDEEVGAKKQLFQRVWTPEDEVEMLKALIEFQKRGSDASSDMAGFHEFVKKSFHADRRKLQVSEKVRRMKKKYMNIAEKAKKGKGKEPTFAKDHDKLVYELSKKVWGAGGNVKKGRRNAEEKAQPPPKSPPPSKLPSGKPAEVMPKSPPPPKLTSEKPAEAAPKSPPPSKLSSEKLAEVVPKSPPPSKLSSEKPAGVEPKSPPPSKSSSEKAAEVAQYKPLEENENHVPLNSGGGIIEGHYQYLDDYLRSTRLGEIDKKRALELMSHSEVKEWGERSMKLWSKERDVIMERTEFIYELTKKCYDLIKNE